MQETPIHPNVPAQVASERTHLVMPSLPHWIEPTVEYLRQKAILSGACHESRAGKLLVALLEALANAVIHGNLEVSSQLKEAGDDSFARCSPSGQAIRRCRAAPWTLSWTTTGRSAGGSSPTRDRVSMLSACWRCLSDDPEVMLASGRGILMMHSFLDDVRYDLGGRRLTLTLNQPSGAEKRRERRLPMQVPLRVAPARPDGTADVTAASPAVAQDLSEHGVALLQHELVEGTRIFIGIPRDGETVYVPAAVRHCRTIGDGSVQLGCEFEAAAPARARWTPRSSWPAYTKRSSACLLDIVRRRRLWMSAAPIRVCRSPAM